MSTQDRQLILSALALILRNQSMDPETAAMIKRLEEAGDASERVGWQVTEQLSA